MLPLRKIQNALSACRRAGYSYYFVAHNNGAGPPIQTALDDSTLSLVSGEVSRLYQGGEDPSPFTLLSEGDKEEEEEFR